MKRRMVCKAQSCATRDLVVEVDPKVTVCISCGVDLKPATPDFSALFGRDAADVVRDLFEEGS